MKQVALKTLKKGDTFKRNTTTENIYIRGHYNHKNAFGPAGYSCTDFYDMNREIFLRGSTMVWINFTH